MAASKKSLKRRFAGKEADLVRDIKKFGIAVTMDLYGIKDRPHFIRWLRDNTDAEWQPSPLAGLKGGNKVKWVKEHRDTILDCLEIFGVDWVKTNFDFTHDTLEQYIQFSHQPFDNYDRKLTRLERVELDLKEALRRIKELEQKVSLHDTRIDMAQDWGRETRFAQRQLQESYARFSQDTARQITEGLTIAVQQFLQHTLKPDESLQPFKLYDLTIDSLIGGDRKMLGQGEEMPRSNAQQVTQPKPEIAKKIKKMYFSAHPFATSRQSSIKES